MTDIATGWTVNRSVKNKAALVVTEAIEHARRVFPFPILGIDSDYADLRIMPTFLRRSWPAVVTATELSA
jgi:hypothetical protein